MRLSRLLPVLPAALLAFAGFARGDDTKDFLDPDNWEGRADIWKIEKGTITGETKEDPKYNTFFCTKKKYSDFELSCKVTLKDGEGNSGFQIRSFRIDKEGDDKPFRVSGPQADIGKGYWGSLYGEGVGGMMKQADGKLIDKAVKDKEANDYKVVVKGNKFTIAINGETMVDDEFPKTPDKKDTPAEGIIALQVHAGYKNMKVEFTDIKFTDLSKKK